MRQVVVLMCVSTVLSCALFVCDGRNKQSHLCLPPKNSRILRVPYNIWTSLVRKQDEVANGLFREDDGDIYSGCER